MNRVSTGISSSFRILLKSRFKTDVRNLLQQREILKRVAGLRCAGLVREKGAFSHHLFNLASAVRAGFARSLVKASLTEEDGQIDLLQFWGCKGVSRRTLGGKKLPYLILNQLTGDGCQIVSTLIPFMFTEQRIPQQHLTHGAIAAFLHPPCIL